MKTCTKCKQELPLERFGLRSGGRTYYSWCKTCNSQGANAWTKADRKANPGKYAARDKKEALAKYGLTVDQFVAMWDAQGGVCLTCPKTLTGGPGGHAIDHCHTTGKVRGLLCSPCNKALGMVYDNPDTLRRLADYLEQAA